MIRDQTQVPASGLIKLILALISAVALKEGYTSNEKWYRVLILTLPLLLLVIINTRRKNKNDFNHY